MPNALGDLLRRARLARGYSLRAVAEVVGVSASLISQVEVGKTQPSVATLYALANYLDVSLDELLDSGKRTAKAGASAPAAGAPEIQRGADNPVIEMENGVRWERLASGPDGSTDALLVTYQPGAGSSVEGLLMRHSGHEYAYLLEGELTVHLEFGTEVMRAGDSIQFSSTRPHMYRNDGPGVAKGIWFVEGRQEKASAHSSIAASRERAAKPPASAVEVLQAIESLG